MLVEVKNLKKSYGQLQVLKGISFSIQPGEIFAILGPNGAGKTTCVEILEGYRDFDSGQVSVLGHDPAKSSVEFKERIGIVVQTSGIENELTCQEALELYASTYKVSKNPAELLELVQLTEKAQTRIDKLSGGQKRRLDLALGLVGDPDLLFLDEPTTGFSPEARQQAWEMLANLKSLGKTILLTSHYMEEVERLADRMVILLNGEIIQKGKPQELKRGATNIKFKLPQKWEKSELQNLKQNLKHAEVEIKNGQAHILTESPTEVLDQLIQKAKSDSVELENLRVHPMGLEDFYLETIGENE